MGGSRDVGWRAVSQSPGSHTLASSQIGIAWAARPTGRSVVSRFAERAAASASRGGDRGGGGSSVTRRTICLPRFFYLGALVCGCCCRQDGGANSFRPVFSWGLVGCIFMTTVITVYSCLICTTALRFHTHMGLCTVPYTLQTWWATPTDGAESNLDQGPTPTPATSLSGSTVFRLAQIPTARSSEAFVCDKEKWSMGESPVQGPTRGRTRGRTSAIRVGGGQPVWCVGLVFDFVMRSPAAPGPCI